MRNPGSQQPITKAQKLNSGQFQNPLRIKA